MRGAIGLAARALTSSWVTLTLVASCVGAPGGPPSAPGMVGQAPHVAPTHAASVHTSFERLTHDPRLSAVAALLADGRKRDAAEAMAVALDTSAPSDRPLWDYFYARLLEDSGARAAAAEVFRRCGQMPWPLAEYARLDAARLLLAGGDAPSALVQLDGISSDFTLVSTAATLRAQAFDRLGDSQNAIATRRESLRTQFDARTAITLAKTLLDQPDGAAEALTLARQCLIDGKPAEQDAAAAIEKAALAKLPASVVAQLSSSRSLDTVARARRLIQQGGTTAARKLLAGVLGLQSPGDAGARCEAHYELAKLDGREGKRDSAAVGFGRAATACAEHRLGPEVLYYGGRASAANANFKETVARFAELEARYPSSRFADDARLRGARASLELGERERYVQMLSSLPDAYPGGDRTPDGLFELAVWYMNQGQWDAASVPLERGLVFGEVSPSEAGRFAYFLARGKELKGDPTAQARFAEIIHQHPLSYYMGLAYARLSAADPRAAASILGAAMTQDAQAPAPSAQPTLEEQERTLRMLLLARLGEWEYIQSELDRLAAARGRAISADAFWSVALVLLQNAEPERLHALFRGLLAAGNTGANVWLDRYPVGSWRLPWATTYPQPFADVVSREAERSQIPGNLIYAIMREESAFNPSAVSHASAIGLMQLILPTAKSLGKDLNIRVSSSALKKPDTNIALGAAYLSRLRAKFPNNVLLAVPGYNAGPGAPTRWLKNRHETPFDLWVETIPFEETREYTKRVLATYNAYAFLYPEGGVSEAMATPQVAYPAATSSLLSAVPADATPIAALPLDW